jgi:hypothetical protein
MGEGRGGSGLGIGLGSLGGVPWGFGWLIITDASSPPKISVNHASNKALVSGDWVSTRPSITL